MRKYNELNTMEKDYVNSVYEEQHITNDIETFFEDNFVICECCNEITYRDELTDNDFINAGGEMVICQYCAE